MDDPSPVVGEHDEDEEDAQARGGDGADIEGDQVPDVVGEDRPPGLGRRGMLGLESLAGPEPALSDGMEHVSAKRVRTPTSGRESRVRRGLNFLKDESQKMAVLLRAWKGWPRIVEGSGFNFLRRHR